MADKSSDPISLKEYLKKYTSNDDNEKKERDTQKPDAAAGGIIVVDDDPVWQKPTRLNDNPSPERQQKPSFPAGSDLPRRRRPRKGCRNPPPDLSPPRKPLSGLVSSKEFREEMNRKRKEEWLMFKRMDPAVSGLGAEPVYRCVLTGKRVSKEEFLESRRKKRYYEKRRERNPKPECGGRWGRRGEFEGGATEADWEKRRRFGRSRDEADIDAMLRERGRWGEPRNHPASSFPIKRSRLSAA